jgi:hypothetical protein
MAEKVMARPISIVVLLAILALHVPHPAIAAARQPSMKAWIGTWKRSVARSSYSPGPPPQTEQTVTFEIVNGLLQVTDIVSDAQGQSARNVYTVNFDGAVYPVDPAQGLTRTYRWIDERKFEGVNRVKGDETTMVEFALAADGKVFTSTITGITAQGQLVHHVVVYEKQ